MLSLASEGDVSWKKVLISRMHAAMAMARRAATAESRLATRFGDDTASRPPTSAFLVTRKEPANVGEQAALRLPNPANLDRKPGFGGGRDDRDRDRGGRR